MSEKCSPMTILLAEDDQDDYLLTVNALKEARFANDLHLVKDGEELMEYLQKMGKYENHDSCPRPGLIKNLKILSKLLKLLAYIGLRLLSCPKVDMLLNAGR